MVLFNRLREMKETFGVTLTVIFLIIISSVISLPFVGYAGFVWFTSVKEIADPEYVCSGGQMTEKRTFERFVRYTAYLDNNGNTIPCVVEKIDKKKKKSK